MGFGPFLVKLCSIHIGTGLSRYFSPLRLRARVVSKSEPSRSRFTITLTGLHLLSVDSMCFDPLYPRAKFFTLLLTLPNSSRQTLYPIKKSICQTSIIATPLSGPFLDWSRGVGDRCMPHSHDLCRSDTYIRLFYSLLL